MLSRASQWVHKRLAGVAAVRSGSRGILWLGGTTTVAVALAVAAVIVVWGTTRSPQDAYDDAFITFRYADNLRRGLGLVYNPGEWVLGTTTPLFALLLGAVGLVTPDIVVAGQWIGVFGWVATAWAAMAVLWQAQRPRASLAAGLLLALEPWLVRALGMETPLVIAFMLWLAWAWLGGHKKASVCLAAALLLTRQDGALWVLLLGLEVWRREHVPPWREALATVLLTLPWLAWALWRYGSVVPNSVTAKVGQNQLMQVGGQSPFWQTLWDYGSAGLHPTIAALYAAAFLLGVWVVARYAGVLWWLPAWMIAYVATYTWLDVVNFSWYFVPPLVTAGIIAALGIGSIWGDGAGRHWQTGARLHGRAVIRAFPAFGVLMLAVLLAGRGAYMQSANSVSGHPAAYKSVGRWLAQHTPTSSSVASIEIGVIGYLSQRPILDTMGLVSRDMTRHQVGWTETLAYAINAHQPDYAVVLPGTAWEGIVDRWWFQKQYEPAAAFDNVSIFRLREHVAPLIELPAEVAYADGLTLTGVAVSDLTIQPGTALEAWPRVHVQSTPKGRYFFTLYLMDVETYERFAETTTEPLDGRYRSRRWQPGDRLALPMRLKIPDELEPGAYRLGVILYDVERQVALRWRESPEVSDPDVRIGWFRSGNPVGTALPAGLTERGFTVKWDEGIELTGVGLPSLPVAPGAVLPVYFSWRASQPIIRELTTFVHLVDAEGRTVAQRDGPPLSGRWPMPVWQAGDELHDLFEIVLPAALAPGPYELRVGFYDRTGRLMLADGGADYWNLPDAVTITGQR